MSGYMLFINHIVLDIINSGDAEDEEILRFANLTFDQENREARGNGYMIKVTPTNYELLILLPKFIRKAYKTKLERINN